MGIKTVNQNLHVLIKLKDSQFVKMVTQLLLSLSVFSFLFSQSYPLLHSLNFCLSTFPYQLFTRTIDKNFMFLLCNGLLVFLAKYSGLVSSLSLSSLVEESESDPNKHMIIGASQSDRFPIIMPQNKEQIVGAESSIVDFEDNILLGLEEEVNEMEIEIEKAIFEDKEDKEGSEFKDSKDDDEEEEEEKVLVHDVTEDIYVDEEEENIEWLNEFEEEFEEEEEEIGNGKLSTEEMDKKFDEFIRRMKEELRVEAQRQLIMV